MAINTGFETLGAVRAKVQDDGRRFCGAQTTSGSICRAAPMANGRCVQHGGQARVSAYVSEQGLKLELAGETAGTPDAAATIARARVEFDLIECLIADLPLATRQQLVPDVRALAARALSIYNQLLAQNRSEATTRLTRALAG